ncbi:hypothetical protein PLESTM_002002100 [Pleodorina starrii]|nr:hypothetical protein PLESTM_002002100 [Pleodorina starrii]
MLSNMELGKSLRTASLVLGLCLVICVRWSAGQSDHPAKLLQSCWNDNFDPSPRTFQEWLGGRTPSFQLTEVWWSKHNSSAPLTIFTSASVDRLPMVEAQCRDYVGPLVAAVYVPVVVRRISRFIGDDSVSGLPAHRRLRHRALLQQQQQLMKEPLGSKVAAVRADMQALFDRMEAGGGSTLPPGRSCCCQLRLLLFTERVADRQMATLMPTNSMRNAAMLAVQTPLAAMIDVDLGVSDTFNKAISNKTWADLLVQNAVVPQPKIFIPTAWEPNHTLDMHTATRMAELALRGSKADLIQLWLNNTLQIFQIDVCKHCHRPFNHSVWANATAAYSVEFKKWFEPWGALWRFHDPGYDERFRGWYFNKVSHVEAMARLWHFQFIVLPESWLVHRPHTKIAAAELHHGASANNTNVTANNVNDASLSALLQKKPLGNAPEATMFDHFMTYIMNLSELVRELMSQGKGYVPQINHQLVHCRRVLPWWMGQGRPGEWRH